jgi:outer membrane protein
MFYQHIKPLVFSLIFLISSHGIAADSIKIGYVKVDEVIQKASISKAAENKLKTEFSKRDAALKKLGTEFKKKVEIFDRDQAILSNDEKKKIQRDISDMERDLRRKNRETKEDLNQRRNEELGAVIQKARAVIKKIAEKEKYDLIVENAVYAAPSINITDKVIKALNAKK